MISCQVSNGLEEREGLNLSWERGAWDFIELERRLLFRQMLPTLDAFT